MVAVLREGTISSTSNCHHCHHHHHHHQMSSKRCLCYHRNSTLRAHPFQTMAQVTGEHRDSTKQLFRKQKRAHIRANLMQHISQQRCGRYKEKGYREPQRTQSENYRRQESIKMISNGCKNQQHNQQHQQRPHPEPHLNLNVSQPQRPHLISIIELLFLISFILSFGMPHSVQCRHTIQVDTTTATRSADVIVPSRIHKREPTDYPKLHTFMNAGDNNTSSLLNFDILAKEFDDDSTSRSNLDTLLKVIEDTRGLKNKTRKHIHDLIVLKDQKGPGANQSADSTQTQMQHRRIVYEDTIFLERAIREISGKMNMSYEGESRSDPAIHWMILYNDTTILVVRSANKYYYWTYAQTVGSLVIFCMIVVGNASILHRLKSSRRRRSNVNYFIVQLAIADLLVGIFSVTLDSLLRLQKAFVWGLFACRASKYISVLFIYSSTNLLVALSIDRWEAVVKPLAFTRNRSRGYHLVAASWIFAFVCAFPVIPYTKVDNIDGLPQCWIDLSNTGWRVYMIYLTCLLLILPTLIIAICYTHIVYTIWNKARQVSRQQNHRHQQHDYPACKGEHRKGSRKGRRSLGLNGGTPTPWIARPESASDLGSGTQHEASSAHSSNQQQQQQQQQQQHRGQVELDKASLRLEDDEILLGGDSFGVPRCRQMRATVTRLGRRFRRRCTVEIGSRASQNQPGAIFGKAACNLLGVSLSSRNADGISPLTPPSNQSLAKNINNKDRLSSPVLTSGGGEDGGGGAIEMMQGPIHGGAPRVVRPQRTSSTSSLASSLIASSQTSICDDSSVGRNEGATRGKPGDNLQAPPLMTQPNDLPGGGGGGGDRDSGPSSTGKMLLGDRQLTGAPDAGQAKWQVVGVAGAAGLVEVVPGDERHLTCASQRAARSGGQRASRRAMSEDLGCAQAEELASGLGVDASEGAVVRTRTHTAKTKGSLITITSGVAPRRAGRCGPARTLAEAVGTERIVASTRAMQTSATIASSSPPQHGNRSDHHHERHHNGQHAKHQAHPVARDGQAKGRDLDFAGQQHGSGVIPKARVKTIKMTLVIVAAYILCWSPFLIVNLCVVFKFIGNNTNVSHALLTLTQSLAHLNSAVNPIIFWIFSSKRSQTNANTTTTGAGGAGGGTGTGTGTGGGGGGGSGGTNLIPGATHTSGLFQQIASNGACKTANATAVASNHTNNQSQPQHSKNQRAHHKQTTSSSNM